MTAWERARELVVTCLPLLPLGKTAEFGRFLFDGESSIFSYRLFGDEERGVAAKVVTACFDLDETEVPGANNFVSIGLVTGGRSYFLFKDSLYEEPAIFNQTFPALHCRWDRDDDPNKGLLKFLRIDFSDDDFVNYEEPELSLSMKEGKEELFRTLPEKLIGVGCIIDMFPIHHSININWGADQILKNSELEAFAGVCRAPNP